MHFYFFKAPFNGIRNGLRLAGLVQQNNYFEMYLLNDNVDNQ
jgi:hypothetical protein